MVAIIKSLFKEPKIDHDKDLQELDRNSTRDNGKKM